MAEIEDMRAVATEMGAALAFEERGPGLFAPVLVWADPGDEGERVVIKRLHDDEVITVVMSVGSLQALAGGDYKLPNE